MRNEKIGIAKEGYPFIGLLAVTAIVFAFIDLGILAFITLGLLWFSCFFFRDPERVIPTQANIAVSPADGKIIKITPAKDLYTGEDVTLVSVFMNVFSVHVNRSPVNATIKEITYYEGAFFNAAWDKASTDNERCAYSLEATDGSHWSMVQISGLIARRIVCRVAVGDSLEKGERYGLIRFGSRVDIYIPKTYSPKVHIGDTVFAGQTIIAEKHE